MKLPATTPFALLPFRRVPAAAIRRALAAAALVGSLIGTSPVLAQGTLARLAQPARPTDWREDLALLQDPILTPEARSAAARRALQSTDPEALNAIIELLGPDRRAAVGNGGAGGPGGAGDMQTILLREIGQLPLAPLSLLAPIEVWLRESTPEKHLPFYRAISSIRVRAAANLLISYALPSTTAENRDAVFQALARLSGRTDLGTDREAWAKWLTSVESLSEEQWQQQLVANQASRADLLRIQRDDALRRLVESERNRFLAASDTQSRSLILASLLRDDMAIIRRLGIELVNRELANARDLGPQVGQATLELLKDPSADVRSLGADIVDRLVPTGGALAVRDALARERNPNVLAKLLRLARRFPDVAPPEMLIGWLGADTVVRQAAIDAFAALQAAGLMASPIDLDRALQTLRTERPEDLSLDGLKLLAELGSDADRQVVARMLESNLADTRLRAAHALAPFPEWLDKILIAAREDPTLFSVSAGALARHRASVAGYGDLISLPPPTPAAMREAVGALCQSLSLADLCAVAQLTHDAETRETVLARVVNLTARTPSAPDLDPFAGEGGQQLIDALLILAQTQLELIRPGAALGTLDLLPQNGAERMTKVAALRLKALLYLDRIDDALQIETDADAWLDGMAYSVALPHAMAIGMEIDLAFGSGLTAEQRKRLADLNLEARKPRSQRERSAMSR